MAAAANRMGVVGFGVVLILLVWGVEDTPSASPLFEFL